MDKDLVSTFMKVTSCESQAYAVQHLASCRWNLDEAINLYFNAGGPSADAHAPVPISDGVDVQMEKDDCDDGVRGYNGGYDVRGTAHKNAPFIMDKAPYPAPVPAVPVHALTEIKATGWGEAEPGGGEAGVENVDGGGGDQTHDVDEDDDSRSSEKDSRMGGSSDEEDDEGYEYDNMSYSYSDDEVQDDEDDDDAYYASIEDDGSHRMVRPQQAPRSVEDLYRRPLDLMFNGHFHAAKVRAAREDRLLLVNLQARDFQSELHNRDLWSDEQVKNVVKGSFVFFLRQKSDDYLQECAKVSSFYRLEDDELPAVLILDPITGQLLDKRSGQMTPGEFIKYTGEYTKLKPSALSRPKFVKKVSASAEQGSASAAAFEKESAAPEISAPAAEAGEKGQEIPDNSAPATASGEEEAVAVGETESPDEMVDDDDEPMEGEKRYKLRIRFPDGTMVPKEFGCKRRVSSLFAFCRSVVRGGGEAAEQRAFRIMRFAGGAFEAVQRDGGATFEDLGLNFSALSVVFDS